MVSGVVQDDVIECVTDIIAFLHHQTKPLIDILELDNQEQVL
jgi:hypothetical protein